MSFKGLAFGWKDDAKRLLVDESADPPRICGAVSEPVCPQLRFDDLVPKLPVHVRPSAQDDARRIVALVKYAEIEQMIFCLVVPILVSSHSYLPPEPHRTRFPHGCQYIESVL